MLLSEINAIITGSVSNIVEGSMPTTPDNVVVIRRAGGTARDVALPRIQEPYFQVRVRNTSYAAAETICDTIKELLHVYRGGNFLIIRQSGDTLDLGRDENNRAVLAVDFNTIREL